MRIRQPVGLGLVAWVALVAAVLAPPVAAADASLRIKPSTIAVANGTSFTIEVIQEAPVAMSGAQVSIGFDATILQVVSVSAGAAYATAPIFLPKDLDAGIRVANETGHLAQVAAAFTPPDAVLPGAASFLSVRFQVVGCGSTDITLPEGGPFNAQMISGQSNGYGRPMPVTTASGHVTVTSCAGPGTGITDASQPGTAGMATASIPVEIISSAGVIALGLLGGLVWRTRRRKRHDDVAW